MYDKNVRLYSCNGLIWSLQNIKAYYKCLKLLQLPVYGILTQHSCYLLHSQWQKSDHKYVCMFCTFYKLLDNIFYILLGTPNMMEDSLQSFGISETCIINSTQADMNGTVLIHSLMFTKHDSSILDMKYAVTIECRYHAFSALEHLTCSVLFLLQFSLCSWPPEGSYQTTHQHESQRISH